MTDAVTKTREVTKTKIKEPKKFKVIVLNDDHTPMEFVIAMFISIFKHAEDLAKKLTLKIHTEGSAVAGIYCYEIAEQKGIEITISARTEGYPLQIKLEPEAS